MRCLRKSDGLSVGLKKINVNDKMRQNISYRSTENKDNSQKKMIKGKICVAGETIHEWLHGRCLPCKLKQFRKRTRQ